MKKKLETYGRRKDFSARAHVVLFGIGLIIFVALLSVGASFIAEDNEGAESITGAVGAATVSPSAEKGTTVVKKEDNTIVIKQDGAAVAFEPINFDFSVLETDPIIQELPKKAVIALKIGSHQYTLTKGSIVKTRASEPDLIMSIPTSYLTSLNGGLCETVKKANNAGDLIITPELSQTKLAWKYRGMLKYKECLGL